jgi:hypothetical protein
LILHLGAIELPDILLRKDQPKMLRDQCESVGKVKISRHQLLGSNADIPISMESPSSFSSLTSGYDGTSAIEKHVRIDLLRFSEKKGAADLHWKMFSGLRMFNLVAHVHFVRNIEYAAAGRYLNSDRGRFRGLLISRGICWPDIRSQGARYGVVSAGRANHK